MSLHKINLAALYMPVGRWPTPPPIGALMLCGHSILPIWAVICITQKQGTPIFMAPAGQILCVRIFPLPSLEACSARFYALAHQHGCKVWNLSDGPSRLLYPRITTERFFEFDQPQALPNKNAVAACLQTESDLNYFVEDGRYWQHANKFDRKKLQEIDQKWLDAASLFPS